MLTRAFSRILLALCGAGLLVAWITDPFVWHVFEGLIFVLLSLWTVAFALGKVDAAWSWTFAPFLAIVAWGGVQLWRGWTVYPFATSTDILRWLTYGAIVFLAVQCFPATEGHGGFRKAFTIYALILAIVSVFQHFLGNGKIFWLFTTVETANMGPFLNRDHYASFIALALPPAIVEMLRTPRQGWFYALASAVLYTSAVAGASRAGFILLTLEVVILVLLLSLPGRAVLGLAALILILGFVVGWDTLYERLLHDPDPYALRREVAQSTVQMVKASPWKGFGLGTWTYVYPAFAIKDFGLYGNAAHNDWLQWACDGGVPLVGFLLALFYAAAAQAKRAPWALGVPIVLLHGLIDFPMQGRFLPAVVFLILGVAVRMRQGRKDPASQGRKLADD
jgi:O-antigen ligase